MKVEIQVEKTTSMGIAELEQFGGNADALICMLLLDKGDGVAIETHIIGIMSWQRDAFHHAIERYAERAEIEFGDVET